MPTAKPQPPALHVVVSEQDEIARQLKALGVDVRESIEDRVFGELVKGWKELGKAPRLVDVAGKLGIAGTTLDGALKRLHSAGRVFRLRRGEWVPKVV